ncbi:DgyrCDS12885 [Dimorphilus gyrociliatus]|uniref:DgyrCDS12885 n=1 Tax=Dimorphilus gyrociliatus TaxID=2664684 RepID=A0A7I8W914_9ANNE|nr:DgyrCDS12885 [Dimorphilus gyrociliatus]
MDEKFTKRENNDNRDKGWAWMVVLGAGIVWFVMGGNVKSFTILYEKFKERYEVQDTQSSWIVTLNGCFKMMTGPIAAYLCKRFNCRTVVMSGALISCIGHILTAYPPIASIYFLYASYGCIAGFGSSLIITPTLIIIPHYFCRYQGRAMAIALAGGSLGSLAMAPLLTFSFEKLAYSGMILISAGLVLQCCISAALYRPVRLTKAHELANSHTLVMSTIDNGELDSEERMKRFTNGKASLIRSRTVNDVNESVMQIREENHNNGDAVTSPSDELLVKKSKSFNVKAKILSIIDLTLLRDPTTVAFCFLMLVTFSTFNVVTTYLGGLCLERKLTNYDLWLILSISSVFEVFGRISLGLIFDYKKVRPVRIQLLGIVGLVFGLVVTNVPNSIGPGGIYSIFMASAMFGSAFYSQHASILSDLVKSRQVEDAFGLVRFFQGIGICIGPTVGGYLHDRSGNYDKTFYFAGISMSITSFIFIIVSLVCLRHTIGINLKNAWRMEKI